MTFQLDYDHAISLDAEDLAEGGIAAGYDLVLPELRKLIQKPAMIEEDLDDQTGSYSVSCLGKTYLIDAPDLDEDEANSWERATVALFSIINMQLSQSPRQFYAINGGNDLFGMFLTAEEVKAAQASLTNKSDWPYLPEDNVL